jgi:transposase
VTDLLQQYTDLVILTIDQMSVYFQATLTRVWALTGQTPIVRQHPQRDHIHFYGALELRTGREIALPARMQSSNVTADFIRILLMLFASQHILLLLDRAPWHKGPELAELFIENADRMEVLYYPPACPELNPQEHVWERARDAISHNHTYPVFEQLISDFEDYLNETLFECDFMEQYAPPVYAAIFE